MYVSVYMQYMVYMVYNCVYYCDTCYIHTYIHLPDSRCVELRAAAAACSWVEKEPEVT
jgi:hypothetical protein